MGPASPDGDHPSFSGLKFLITGGTGHLGSALTHHLVRKKRVSPADIRVLFLAGTSAASLGDLPGLDLFPGDILDPPGVRRAVEGVDLVFHLAASTSFDPRQKARQWRINVEGTRHVLEAARDSPSVRRVCYTGTVNSLGAPSPAGAVGLLADCDPYQSRPRLHAFGSTAETLEFIDRARRGERGWEAKLGIGYFDSKLAAQELVSHYVREFGLDVVSVLPGTLFGPSDTLNGSGIYLLAIYGHKLPGVLRGGFSALHVLDAAEGHTLAMARGRRGARYILTAGARDQLHFREMASAISETLARKFPERRFRRRFPVVPLWAAGLAAAFSEAASGLSGGPCLLSRAAVRAGSQALFYADDAAAAELGFHPERSFREAVEEMVAEYQASNLFAAKGRRIDRV